METWPYSVMTVGSLLRPVTSSQKRNVSGAEKVYTSQHTIVIPVNPNTMCKYRIQEWTEPNGRKDYIIQKRWWLGRWIDLLESHYDYDGCGGYYSVCFHSLDEAQEYIRNLQPATLTNTYYE